MKNIDMENLDMNTVGGESTFSRVDVPNEFEWFDGYNDNFENEYESPIESVSETKMDTVEIDELVKMEDYMWLQNYLDNLNEDQKVEAEEYVKNNYPEFLEDEEGNTFEPMKWWKFGVEKEIFNDFNKKPNFDKRNIKSGLWETLLESYKNAA